jgi:hypothetical protein
VQYLGLRRYTLALITFLYVTYTTDFAFGVLDDRGTTVPENKSYLLQGNGRVSENGASSYLVYMLY